MTEIRAINLDMDGTFVNLYGVEGWLEDILNKSTRPYEVAEPLVNLSALARVLNNRQRNGYTINVISWTAKNATTEYNERVALAKLEWLRVHLPSVQFDNISIVEYGTPKSTCGKGHLFDDEEPNRKEWKGTAHNVENLIAELKALA